MSAPRFSDIRPGSAECRLGQSPWDTDECKDQARRVRIENGLALVDLRRLDDITCQMVEKIAERQGR